MAKEKGAAPTQGPNNVIPLNTTCCVEKCTARVEKMGFCGQHYTWFKEGLVNKKGEKPTDFDKKYQAFVTRKKAA